MDNDLTESEFARLVMAENHIKLLKKQVSDLSIENGILQSERDELRDAILKNNKEVLSNEDKIKAKSDSMVVQLTKQNNKISKQIKMLRDANGDLICRIFKLENTNQTI